MPAIPFPYHYCRAEALPSVQVVLSLLLMFDIACRLMQWYSTESRMSTAHFHPSRPITSIIEYRKLPTHFPHTIASPISKAKSTSTALTKFTSYDARLTIAHLVSRTAHLEAKLSNLAFQHFADRIILSNKIWTQHAVIHNLHRALLSARSSLVSTFCERVQLENDAWKEKSERERLEKDLEKAKRGKVKSIVTMAKTLAANGRKVKKMEEDLRMEQRRAPVEGPKSSGAVALRQEVERYQLAEMARAVQQDLSDQMEEELRGQLLQAKKENEALKDQVCGYERLIEGLWADLQKPKIDSPVA